MGANKSIDVNLPETSEIPEKKRLYDIDYTIFPDSKTEIQERIDYIESIDLEIKTIGDIFLKKISSLENDMKLLHIDSKQNKELIKQKENEIVTLENEYNSWEQKSEKEKDEIDSYLDQLQDCKMFFYYVTKIFTNIKFENVETIPFFNRKTEYMTIHEVLWKFINPGDSNLTYEQHNVTKFSDCAKCVTRSELRCSDIDHDWELKEPYIVKWLNKQPRIVCEEDPRYIYITVIVYVFQFQRNYEIASEPSENQEEKEENIVYEINQDTFELLSNQPVPTTNEDMIQESISTSMTIQTDLLPIQIWSLIFSFLDYTEYYHSRDKLCSIMGIPTDDFMRVWLTQSHHEVLQSKDKSCSLKDTYYYVNGKLHRENDEPAIVMSDGSVEFRICDERHREGDKPARISAKGSEYYYKNGALHRDDDKPAVILRNNGKIRVCKWFKNGFIHRDGDKPAMITSTGIQRWYHYGQLHRTGDKPAMVNLNSDIIKYYQHNELHRLGGNPAYTDGGDEIGYFEYGKFHRINPLK